MDLLGYSLDVDLTPADEAVGAVTGNINLTNFFESKNLITACVCDAELHPDFSVIIDPGDGGVFVNAITADNSTVLAVNDINDVLAEVFLDASADACGDFLVELGPASALSDAEGFPVPYDFDPAMVRVRAASCPEDLDCGGNVGPFDLALLLGFWGPNPGDPAELDHNGEVGPFDLALLLGAWGECP